MLYTKAVPYHNHTSNYKLYLLIELLKIKTIKQITDLTRNILYYSSVYVFDNGIKEIEKHTFYLCMFIEEIIIPESVMYVGETAFIDCFMLKKIYYSNVDMRTTNIGMRMNNIGMHYTFRK